LFGAELVELADRVLASVAGEMPVVAVLRDGEPLRKANGMPFTLPFSPDTTRWRRAAIVELRKLGIHL
jgi:uncharacterized protein with von Willebrand factor type A (vWA) domain